MSTLRTNALEGVDAKNSITIVAGAGNVTTTNVQQGLCKVWISFDGTGTVSASSIKDSFNATSLTDNTTGNYDINFTNDMGNINFAHVSGCRSEISRSLGVSSTSKCTVQTEDDNFNVEDVSDIYDAIFGDLA